MPLTNRRSLRAPFGNLALLAFLIAGPDVRGLDLVAVPGDRPGPVDVPSVSYNPFEDIPPGHPAYDAIETLVRSGILDGFPDGTFKGGRTLTRYDLAFALARARSKIAADDALGPPVSPEERALIEKLSREVGTELSLLGLRTDSLEQRIQRTETQEENLALQKSNVNVLGFYRIEQSLVLEPFRFGTNPDFPFLQEFFPFLNFRDRGVVPLKQETFIRLTGHPLLDGIPASNVEAFAELRTLLVGNGGLHLDFEFSRPGTVGDRVDDLSTQVEDEARIFFNRGHFTLATQNLVMRVFANESATDLTDPDVLFTVDTFAPFSGLEVNGGIGPVSYFASALKRIVIESFTGVDARDIRRFTPQHNREQDVYTLRLAYQPYKDEPRYADRSLTIGGSFVELADDYRTINGFNRVLGVDVQYGRDTGGGAHYDATASYLWSVGFGDRWDRAMKLDGSYQKDGFLGNLKFYRFGPEFRAEVAQNQFIDTDVNFNFHRDVTPGLLEPRTKGENLLRVQLRNDWLGDIGVVENLVLTALFEKKSWSRDPKNPVLNDDERGNRFYLQGIFDMTRRWRVELFSEVQKDIRIDHLEPGTLDPEERGTFSNLFRSDWRIQDNLSLVTELELKDDFDAIDVLDDRFNFTRHKEEVAWQAHPRLFLKVGNEVIFNSDLQLMGVPIFPVNQRNLFRRVVEFNVIPLQKLSIKGLIVRQRTLNNLLRAPAGARGQEITLEDNDTTISVLEALVNFTPALKLRYVFAKQDTDLDNDDVFPLFISDILLKNHYVDISYTPTASTEIRLTFGTEWENPNDPLDNGPAKFFDTVHIMQLRAQTTF